MAAIERFEDVKGWQIARVLTNKIYEVSRQALVHDYTLRDQIRRAVTSIMHNIAEGFDCETDMDFIRFLGYAKRSCTEVQSQLYVALDQEYISREVFDDIYAMAAENRAVIQGFINYLRDHPRK